MGVKKKQDDAGKFPKNEGTAYEKIDDENTKKVIAFQREKILSMSRYGERRDILSVLLEDGKSYGLNEVDALIEEFMEGDAK